MTEPANPTQGRPLTPLQISRVDFAQRDLEAACAAELADLDPAELILVIERLRGRLDDTLALISELGYVVPNQ